MRPHCRGGCRAGYGVVGLFGETQPANALKQLALYLSSQCVTLFFSLLYCYDFVLDHWLIRLPHSSLTVLFLDFDL